MKKLRRLICAGLSLALMLSIAMPVVATDSMNDIEIYAARLISMAVQDPGNDSFDYGSYSLGNAIPTYAIDGGSLGQFNEAIYYPIFCDGQAVGIFTINGANTSDPTYSLGSDFIENLNDAAYDNGSAYSLIIAEHQIFAVTDAATKELVKYDATPMNFDDPNSDTVASLDNDEMRFIEQETVDYQAIEYSVDDILSAVADVELEKATDEQISIQLPRTTRAFKAVGNVPRATQATGSNWCWAYTSWSIGEFMNGKDKDSSSFNYSVSSLVSYRGKTHGSSGSNVDVIDILKNKYSLPNATQYNALSNAEMKKLIGDKKPFSMNCSNTSTSVTLGHMVTCYGYEDAYSPIQIAVMDSLAANPNQYRYMTSPTSSTSTDYKITCGNYTYKYVSSVTPVKK